MAGKRRRGRGDRLQARTSYRHGDGGEIEERDNWDDLVTRRVRARLSYPQSTMLSLQWLFQRILAIVDEKRDSEATLARRLVNRFHRLVRKLSASPPLLEASFKAPSANQAEAEFPETTVLLDSGRGDGISSTQSCLYL